MSELKRENQLLQQEVEKINKQQPGVIKPSSNNEIFRHLMRSLDRSKKIIDFYQQQD